LLGPIFTRELLTLPRRDRHYLNRAAYIGILWVLGLTAWQAMVGWSSNVTLFETTRFGPILFRLLSLVQLTLLLFFAALSAAGSITIEKDRRTFVLLLLTDMRNYEIVLGKLLGSLLEIGLFLLATVPVLMCCVLLGGVGPHQVFEAMLVLTGTTLAAGSLGVLLALWREKTFQSLALCVLFMVLYLLLVRGLAALPAIGLWPNDDQGLQRLEFLQASLDPFLALVSVQQPPSTDIPFATPPYLFFGVMLLLSLAMTGWGMIRLRVWNPSGEPIMQREKPEDDPEAILAEKEGFKKGAGRRDIHAAPGAVRTVGENPILWREIATRAYGRRPLIVKLAYFIVVGLIAYSALAPLFSSSATVGSFAAAYGLVPVCILTLLLVAAQAATSITTERDVGALDLLLVTDLTPREFIYGKLWGICWNTKEYLIPPLILMGVYAWLGRLASPPEGHPELALPMNFESFACIVGAALIIVAFTMVLGIHVSLRTLNSRLAILNTLSTIFFLSVGTLVCIYLILINGRFEYQWTSFLVFAIAGVGGLMWVLNGSRPSGALILASWFGPFAVLYCVMSILVGKPGSTESADPLIPFLVVAFGFGFTIRAMMVPLLSEFDVALGRTTAAGAEE